jgi:hypothetical protein
MQKNARGRGAALKSVTVRTPETHQSDKIL